MFTSISTAKIDPETIVGIWLLNEGTGKTVKDSSKNEFDGDIAGDVKWTTEGKFGNALSFPGNTSSKVEIPHDDSMNLVTMTLVAWVKMDEQQADGNAPIYKVGIADGNNRNYSLRLHCCPGSDAFYFEFSSPPGSWHATHKGQNQALVKDGKWHHIAGTYDKKMLLSYVDGVLDGAETAWEGTPDTNEGPIQFGARSLKGVLDEVGIFNVALGQAEIEDIMNSGLKRLAAVSPREKLATVWGKLKAEN